MKTFSRLLLVITSLTMISCSAQRQVASRITGDWTIEEYIVLLANGTETKMENAGTITFLRNGRGQQTFSTAITHIDATSNGEFRWDNTAHVVFIWGTAVQYRKAWIIVNSSRSKQVWRSTDSEGNVQSMHLKRRKD